MNYRETLDFLYSQFPAYHRIGMSAYKANLDNTVALCNRLGNPQNGFRSVHVAGTNGKGSVSHMLASILQEQGLKTGLYTSPHLRDFRERIRIDGEMIPESRVVRFVEENREAFSRIRPSFFEMSVGMAFHYFAEETVDIAIIETGLGGRLDSTNIITPLLSVITNISYDHMQFLGTTLEQIASEKAGIIKPGIPVVVGETQIETEEIFREKARSGSSRITFADMVYSTIIKEPFAVKAGFPSITQPGIVLDIYRENRLFLPRVRSPLGGTYQKKNIVTVMAACEELGHSGLLMKKEQLRDGIEKVVTNTGLEGRWQVLSFSPTVICDVGHNESGLHEVMAQIATLGFNRIHIVFGMVSDKELDPVFRILPREAEYYFCRADIPRGLDAGELCGKARAAGLTGHAYGSVREALAAAKENAAQDDLVFVGGSTFIVAEAL